MSIEFPLDWDDFEDSWEILEEGETPQQVLEAESEEGWRALMARSLEALSRNKSAHFEALELRKLVPKEVSTFRSDVFHHFLGTVRRFKLSVKEYDNGAGWVRLPCN